MDRGDLLVERRAGHSRKGAYSFVTNLLPLGSTSPQVT